MYRSIFKVAGWRSAILPKKDTDTGVFLLILRIFLKNFFHSTPPDVCISKNIMLTHYSPVLLFCTPEKIREPKGFLMLSGVIQKATADCNGLKVLAHEVLLNCCTFSWQWKRYKASKFTTSANSRPSKSYKYIYVVG